MKIVLNKPITIVYDGSVREFSGTVETSDKNLAKLLLINGGIEQNRPTPTPEPTEKSPV